MEEELDQLKSVLRSLVVSCPTQVDARSLLRDYRSMVGSQLPFAEFGYRDPIAFLRERCSDCFLFQGSEANPDLTLIVPDALKHVDKFVQKQKVSSSNSAAKYKGKRRSVLASTVKPSPDLIASTFSNGRSMPNRRRPETVRKEQEYTNCIQSTKVKENTTVNNDTARHNGTQHTQSQVNSRERPHERRESTREDDDSGRLTASSSSSGHRRTQLEELKRELRELVVEHPDGVLCTDLIRLYRQRHSRELNFGRFGFTSVLSLAGSAGGVRVAHDAAHGDWLLSDAERAPPAPRPAPRAAPAAPRVRPAADPEDALPGIPYRRRARAVRAAPRAARRAARRARRAARPPRRRPRGRAAGHPLRPGGVPGGLHGPAGQHPGAGAARRGAGRPARRVRGRGVLAEPLLAAAPRRPLQRRHGDRHGRDERVLRQRGGAGAAAAAGRRARRPLLQQLLRRRLAPLAHRARAGRRHCQGASRGLRHCGALRGERAAAAAARVGRAAGAGAARPPGARAPARRRPPLAARRRAALPAAGARPPPRRHRQRRRPAGGRAGGVPDGHVDGRGPVHHRRAGARRTRGRARRPRARDVGVLPVPALLRAGERRHAQLRRDPRLPARRHRARVRGRVPPARAAVPAARRARLARRAARAARHRRHRLRRGGRARRDRLPRAPHPRAPLSQPARGGRARAPERARVRHRAAARARARAAARRALPSAARRALRARAAARPRRAAVPDVERDGGGRRAQPHGARRRVPLPAGQAARRHGRRARAPAARLPRRPLPLAPLS